MAARPSAVSAASVAIAFLALAIAVPVGATLDPSQRAVEARLLCVTTHQSLLHATSPLARQMKRMIAREIATGWTERQILNRFVQELGPQVLARL